MDIGGQVVLTLVPHSQYCRPCRMNWQRRLESKILVPPDAGYTTLGGGGHLDRKTAVKFTNFLITELVKTNAFRKAFNKDRQ
jgi:hypothetical protein